MSESEDRTLSKDEFMSFIRKQGFSGCPICKNNLTFFWGHAVDMPDGSGQIHMTSHLPGTTTMPGKRHEVEPYPTDLYVVICGRCTHIMPFAKQYLHLILEMERNGQ